MEWLYKTMSRRSQKPFRLFSTMRLEQQIVGIERRHQEYPDAAVRKRTDDRQRYAGFVEGKGTDEPETASVAIGLHIMWGSTLQTYDRQFVTGPVDGNEALAVAL